MPVALPVAVVMEARDGGIEEIELRANTLPAEGLNINEIERPKSSPTLAHASERHVSADAKPIETECLWCDDLKKNQWPHAARASAARGGRRRRRGRPDD